MRTRETRTVYVRVCLRVCVARVGGRDPKQICLLVINSPDWHNSCRSYGKAEAYVRVCLRAAYTVQRAYSACVRVNFFCRPVTGLCVREAERNPWHTEGISMSQHREWGSRQRRPAALCLPSIRPVCQLAALLTHSCLSANLYRVDFTDRLIGALEAEERGGEVGLWQRDKWGNWEQSLTAVTVRSRLKTNSWFDLQKTLWRSTLHNKVHTTYTYQPCIYVVFI